MESVFDPIVNRIIKLVQNQTEKAYQQKEAKIRVSFDLNNHSLLLFLTFVKRIVLVGGLGSSKYLFNKLESWCSSNGNIELLSPKYPETAVLRGAGIRAVENIAPFLKYARRHYGFEMALRFRENIDDEKHAFFDGYDNKKYCSGRVLWCVSKGDEIIQGWYHAEECTHLYNPGEVIKSSITLYQCDGDQQPYRIDDPGVKKVGEITYDFPSDFNFDIHSDSRFNPRLKKEVHQFHFQVQVIFGDRGANLQFKMAVGGRLITDTKIDFPDV
ncbi:hypothetical protein OCU04_003098 [Sclerotinia nivalis]|uniref:Uncharacterized protein n=1 Tax=Sclerotinia nivalis TaxID=352851 RepID=A0A9X0AVN1_9HELO|nr:hypothetical protein OCU04_003098 [Sclerotinia nivalis]